MNQNKNNDKKFKKRKRSRSKSKSLSSGYDIKKIENKEKKSSTQNINYKTKTIDQFILFYDNNQKIDHSMNRSYQEKGIIKITNEIIIPDHLLFAFSGKNFDLLKIISNKTGSILSIHVKIKI